MKNLLTTPLLLSALLFSVVLLSCDKDEVTPTNKSTTDSTTTDLPDEFPTVRPGGFAVSRLVNTSNSRLADDTTYQVNFDLGDVKASQEFLFLLSNSGDVPVFDISLAVNHPQFEISPKHIDTLGASGRANNLLPLISVGVKHGVALNGIGQVDLLKQGAHTGTVSIKGKTIVADDTVEVMAEVAMKVEAKVADINMYINGELLDLSKPDVNVVGASRSYGYKISKNSEVKIVNTGNVPVLLEYTGKGYDSNITTTLDKKLTLGIEDSESFNVSSSDNVQIVVDGKNTVMNYKKIVQETDGRGYISLIIPQ